MRQRMPLQAFTAGVLLLAAACSDQNEPVAPSDQPEPSPLQSASQGTQIDPNSLGRAVRGFGGFYFDAQGAPIVYLKNAAELGAAIGALSPFLRAHGLDPSRVRTRKGDFDWSALERWQALATVEALAVPGAVFVDADEASNRVRIGVEHGTAAGRVRMLVARLGIPDAAVIVQETAPVELAATLRDRVRPIVGGLQIHFSFFLCTLGFNAKTGANENSFITASHCTDTQGGVESTAYWQPVVTVDPQQIATEVADPGYFTGAPCPFGRRCRYSDASRASYDVNSFTDFSLGNIAKTQRAGSITITGSYTITAEGSAVAGQRVNKVGRTTGWSRGRVTNVCVNTNVSGSDITQLCQNFVSATVGAGDSGSPVFAITSGDNVALVGILWGGSGSRLYVFSPLSQIEQELGALTTF